MTVTETTTPGTGEGGSTLFERIGGRPAVTAAVGEFYDRVLADALLQPFFVGIDTSRLRDMLAELATQAFGGPAGLELGDVVAAHRGLPIEQSHMDAVLTHLVGALRHLGVAEDLIGEAATIVTPVADAIVATCAATAAPARLRHASTTRRPRKEKMTTVSPRAATKNGTSPVATEEGPEVLAASASLRAVLDSLQANVFVADTDLNIVYANDHAVATLRAIESEVVAAFGVSVDEVLGGSIHRFHRNAKRVERILHDPHALPHEAQFTFGSVTLKASINGVDVDGRVVGYVVNWEDVSEKIKAEAEMARIQSMMENAPTNMMFADKDLVLRYMNPASLNTLRAIEQYLPCKADEIVGQNIDIFHKNPAHQRNILGNPEKYLPMRS
ncbi:MAG TPA: PAS domain-containing protein, partial [Acidimicrobiales bacterium]|nr:PAS domain-containing protein [Acidimicrobiales bacterium]